MVYKIYKKVNSDVSLLEKEFLGWNFKKWTKKSFDDVDGVSDLRASRRHLGRRRGSIVVTTTSFDVDVVFVDKLSDLEDREKQFRNLLEAFSKS
jgi:hypothetical protein